MEKSIITAIPSDICHICKKTNSTDVISVYSKESGRRHLESDSHKKNQERLGFYVD